MRDEDILPHEMLEAMLFYGKPRVNTNPLAHKLIDTFGSVGKVLNADLDELKLVRGVGDKTAEYLVLLGKFYRMCTTERQRSIIYRFGDEATMDYLHSMFDDTNKEKVYILCLDGYYRVRKASLVLDGSFESVEFEVGMIAETAYANSSKYIVCVHNHPSGIAKASQADRDATAALGAAMRFLGMRLYDSVIVTDNEIHSMINNKSVKIS